VSGKRQREGHLRGAIAWCAAPLMRSNIKVPTWIVDGDHDEAIKRENTDQMAARSPVPVELILPTVSHFAFPQDSTMFNASLLHFLSEKDKPH
jgi:pimeloyl-ACP methyl ester carboxylesterase